MLDETIQTISVGASAWVMALGLVVLGWGVASTACAIFGRDAEARGRGRELMMAAPVGLVASYAGAAALWTPLGVVLGVVSALGWALLPLAGAAVLAAAAALWRSA
jgi:hypothetical protein